MKFIAALALTATFTAARRDAIVAQWSGTFADLTLLTRVGVALLRGKANPIEETAMAKMCNPGKTKHLTKEQRGFLAFQSVLDRAVGFLKDVDPKGLASSYATDVSAAIPRDALIDAKAYDAMIGQNALATAYDKIQHARTIFIMLKEKYGDNLQHVGTKTLEGKPRKVAKAQEVNIMQELRKRYENDQPRLGSELIKYSENPAAYVLPAEETSFDKERAKYNRAKERGLIETDEYNRCMAEVDAREAMAGKEPEILEIPKTLAASA